jgi:protein CpxP
MKASLLARTSFALLLTTVLAGGVGTTAFAQTTPSTAPPATSTAPSGTAATGSAATAPATTGTATPGTATPGTATPGTATTGTATTGTPGSTTATHHATTTHHTRSTAAHASGQTMLQMAEQRITELHARLHITSAEQSQWDQFAQVMRDNAKDVDQAYQQRAAQFQSMNAVENMQSYAQIEQTRAQDMQKLVPAFQTLYASLSDQQKQQADRMFRYQAERAQQQRHKTAAH